MSYKSTVKLPKTKFPMRARLPITEPVLIKYWNKLNLYHNLRVNRAGKPVFTIHDGPPYANGGIHVGHAQGHVTKDIVSRCYNMLGYDVRYVPGWDCHGLPIEWKVEEQYRRNNKEKDNVPVIEFRNECREFAKSWVDVQKSEFKRIGVMGDWEAPYVTMDSPAEARVVSELYKFAIDGSLFQKLRPVLWSTVEQTALAEAETEYFDKKSSSVYVKFPVRTSTISTLSSASIVIWTTTPWTLPASRGIAYAQDVDYIVIIVQEPDIESPILKGDKLLIAQNLLDEFLNLTDIKSYTILASYKGGDLVNTICSHPLSSKGYDFDVPLFAAPFVTTEQGTGLVHLAPAYGIDEFEWNESRNLKIEVVDVINDDGTYKADIPLFSGVHIFQATNKIFAELEGVKAMIKSCQIVHSYPHSWRSKAPLIYRATPQWFISMEANDLRNKAIQAIKDTEWYPPESEARITDMVKSRPDWCISRQRLWGVPIAIFVHKGTGVVLKDVDVQDRIVTIFREEGADSWYSSHPSRFLGSKYKSNHFTQVMDVVDVWFESGCTHAFVLEDRPDQEWPADLCIEGTDQHRGWFQSSLLESCATRGRAPYKAVITHGFVNDESGKKMSKSIGNVISPIDIANEYGADVFRLWAASVNWQEDMRIGKETLDQVSEKYRRFRNTFRFVLGNLNGYTLGDAVEYRELPNLEKWVLYRLFELDVNLKKSIATYEFNLWINQLYLFCSQDLSAIYFDIRKDTLYCDSADSLRRRSCQTVLNELHKYLCHWLAPVLAFTAEEAWGAWGEPEQDSIHLNVYPKIPSVWENKKAYNLWSLILPLRIAVNTAVEIARASNEIDTQLQTSVLLELNQEKYGLIGETDLAELLGVAEVRIIFLAASDASPDSGIDIQVFRITGGKCARCWLAFPVISDSGICVRCSEAVRVCIANK